MYKVIYKMGQFIGQAHFETRSIEEAHYFTMRMFGDVIPIATYELIVLDDEPLLTNTMHDYLMCGKVNAQITADNCYEAARSYRFKYGEPPYTGWKLVAGELPNNIVL